MSKMTGARALVQHLRAEKVSHVFSLPGQHVLDIVDALREAPDIRLVLTRHEQGAAFMAYGFARATRTPGVCLSTVGPGATNLVSGVAAAFKGNAPMVAITGKQTRAVHQRDSVQEMDQTGLFSTITKWNYMAPSAGKISETMRHAFRVALADGGGPVQIEFPGDVLAEEIDVVAWEPARYRAEDRPACRSEEVREAIELLRGAKSPAILAGRQVLDDDAWDLLRHLAERYRIPVATPCFNMDAFSSAHPMGLGPIGRNGWPIANRVVNQADVLLALGRIDLHGTLGTNDIVSPRSRIVQVCRHPEQIGRVYPVELGIVGTVDSFLSQLLEPDPKLPANPADISRMRADWEATRAARADAAASPVKLQHVVRTLRRLLPPEGIVVLEGGNNAEGVYPQWDTLQPNTLYFCDNQGAVGSALPVAIGVKVARPGQPVVVLCGDCGFMMNVGELETAVREGVNVVVVVFNDFGLGNNRAHQITSYGGRFHAVDYTNPDFGKLAELFGGWGRQVRRGEEVEDALRGALSAGKPAVLDLLIDREDLATTIFRG